VAFDAALQCRGAKFIISAFSIVNAVHSNDNDSPRPCQRCSRSRSLRRHTTRHNSRDDVREVLMQTAIYCGIPAELDSFREAQEVFDEQDAAK
jgi:hypothetical protein